MNKSGNPHEREIVENLAELKEVLDKNKIAHWLQYGTLLGGMLHGMIQAWDDEVDLAGFKKDFENRDFRKKISKELMDRGFLVYFIMDTPNRSETFNTEKNKIMINVALIEKDEDGKNTTVVRYENLNKAMLALLKIRRTLLAEYFGGFKMYFSNGWRGFMKINLMALVNIFPMNFRKGVYNVVEGIFGKMQKKDTWKLTMPWTWFEKQNKIDYHGLKIGVPGKAKLFLDQFYGKKWRKPLKDPSTLDPWYTYGGWEKLENGKWARTGRG